MRIKDFLITREQRTHSKRRIKVQDTTSLIKTWITTKSKATTRKKRTWKPISWLLWLWFTAVIVTKPSTPETRCFATYALGASKIARCPNGKSKASAPTAMLAKPTTAKPSEPSGELPKIVSTSLSAKDIGTGYGFQNWHYVTAKARLSDKATPEPICLDTGCSVTRKGDAHVAMPSTSRQTPIIVVLPQPRRSYPIAP